MASPTGTSIGPDPQAEVADRPVALGDAWPTIGTPSRHGPQRDLQDGGEPQRHRRPW